MTALVQNCRQEKAAGHNGNGNAVINSENIVIIQD
jgi:hypothetical protein